MSISSSIAGDRSRFRDRIEHLRGAGFGGVTLACPKASILERSRVDRADLVCGKGCEAVEACRRAAIVVSTGSIRVISVGIEASVARGSIDPRPRLWWVVPRAANAIEVARSRIRSAKAFAPGAGCGYARARR